MLDWSAIVHEHGRIVWQTAYRLLGNHTEACDCFQETFLSALRSANREPVRNWSAMLKRIATNQAINRLRKRIRLTERSDKLADLAEIPSSNPGPTQEVERRDQIEQLRHGLARLPEREAEILCLRYLLELSHEEIADALGVKTNSVGPLIHRARSHIREMLQIDPDGEENMRCHNAR